jgi:competence protein ComEC
VRLGAPLPFRNPGDPEPAGTPPRTPPILATGRTEAIVPLPPAPRPWWLEIRLWIHARLARELPPVSGALLEGLLIGERRALPPGLVADFRAAGVLHVLAISGFNVGLVAGAAFFVLRLLRLPRRLAAGGVLGALVVFVAVVGSQPSVLRATVMGGLGLVALLCARESPAWNALAGALLGLLALAPESLHDPGLQLSFAATAGLLHLTPAGVAALAPLLPRPLAAGLAASLAAQLAVVPLAVLHWSQLSLAGVVSNLVVVPLAAALSVLGVAALLLATVSDTLAHLVFQCAWGLLLVLRWTVRAAASLPGAMVPVPAPPAAAVAAALGALVLWPLARGRRGRVAAAALAAGAIVATAAGYRADGRLHVVALDVGQGEAILVRAPDGRALLVDTGPGGPGRLDRGERIVLPVLRRLGVRRLAALAVTHGDPDHAGGLASVLAGIGVDEVWVPVGSEGAAWQAPIDDAGVPRRGLARGDRRTLGPLAVTVLHPARDAEPGGGRGAANRGSLALRLEWGEVALVLTGDAETPAEREWLAGDLPLGAALLKVGHHGSRHGTSAAFLDRVAPRLAVISAGARNPFGHPSPATLARLAAAGARIYRTDLDGAVEVESDGRRLTVRRWAFPRVPAREIAGLGFERALALGPQPLELGGIEAHPE